LLTQEEIKRYARHIQLSEIGKEGQQKLKRARVLVIGAGGLGCPALQYLTAAGVGTIGIAEFDNVDVSNLQRQLLYTIDDVGKPKITCAIEKLSHQNSFIKFIAHPFQLTNDNALNIINDYDIIIDGTDNFATRYMVNDACVLLNKILVYGSVNKFEGHVSVFNFPEKVGQRGPTYRCLFPEPPPPESSPNCSELGVLGVLPGVIGTLQANETIKIITEIGNVLSGQLMMMNLLNMQQYTVTFVRNNMLATSVTLEEFKKTDYNYFCNASPANGDNEITADELSQLLKINREAVQLIDVREMNEYPFVEELKELQIPLSKILDNADQINTTKKVVLFCKVGARSSKAITLLKKENGFTNLYNLKGGVEEWLNFVEE
jgi:adenylyltransferase/sulfurtransferase